MTILLATLLAVTASTATPAEPARAVEYLRGRQNEDGGFSEPDAASDPRTTCWVLLAASGAGEKPLEWSKAGARPAEFLAGSASQLSSFEDLELLVMAISSAGGDPRNAAGVDLVSVLMSGIADDGRAGADIRQHCLGIIALASAGRSVPEKCARWLLGRQRADGGWGESDQVLSTDTALAVEALAASEAEAGDEISAGLKLLRERMNPDGGFPGRSGGSDAQTTATVVRAINAAGQDPSSEEWSFHGGNPVGYLSSLQAGDGHFQYAKGVESQPAMTTAMVVPALSNACFPLRAANAGQESAQDPVVSAGERGAGGEGTGGTSAGGAGAGARLGRTGAEGRVGGGSGLWVFIGACAAYLALLMVAVLIAGILAKRARKSGGPASPRGRFTAHGGW